MARQRVFIYQITNLPNYQLELSGMAQAVAPFTALLK
jgi:hypothetical protein